MIKVFKNIPNDIGIAFSGGSDSVAFTHFLMNSKRDISLYHVNHMYSDEDLLQEQFCLDFAKKHNLSIFVKRINQPYQSGSREAFWRQHRYEFLYNIKKQIVVCHTLEDQIETYLLGAIKGQPKFIPYQTRNIIRPFFFTKKEAVNEYLKKHNLVYFKESSNEDISLDRNRLRLNIIPEIRKINLGLEKTIGRLLVEKYK